MQEHFEFTKILIDVGNHAVELRADYFLSYEVAVGRGIFFFNEVRAVGRVGGDVGEEGLVFGFADKLHRLFEPYIGAVALESLRCVVHKIDVIEVVVAPVIGQFAYAA